MDDIKAKFVIVGAGPAGCSAAMSLIELNHKDDVLLIGRESTLAYERPPLSKKALLEEQAQPQFLSEALWLIENAANTLLNTSVIAVNAEEKFVLTDQNQKIYYEKLLLTVGADARKLNIEGEQLDTVFTIRDFKDAQKLKSTLVPNKKMVVVGNGFIGLEVAATANQLGLEVTVVGLTDRVMSRSMPEEVSQVFEKKFNHHGIKFLFNNSLREILGETSVNFVVLNDGKVLDADIVVVGVGAYPNSQNICGIEHLLSNGIAVNANGQTADPYIFAAGDVANRQTDFASETFNFRLEAWEPAREQGRAIAEVMTNQTNTELSAPWMWSDQFDWNVQAIGYGHLASKNLILGQMEDAKFTILQLKNDGALVGAITVNNGKDMTLCRRAIKNNLRFNINELIENKDANLKQILALATA
jgi:3-phenylpropionate/trans-cinnamate dioxygenase ferredoxin reductase component